MAQKFVIAGRITASSGPLSSSLRFGMRRVMLFSILRRSLNSTKHREDEAQSKMLIVELNHRVKNTLSTVQSIVW